jgi:hypothetical protein
VTAFNFTTVPLSGQAVPYTGANQAEISAFAGPGNTESADGEFRVRTPEGMVPLQPGWIVTKQDADGGGQDLFAYGPAAFQRHVPGVPVS